MADDPSDVVTGQHIATLRDGMKKADPVLGKLKTKAASNDYFKERYDKYVEIQKALNSKIDDMERNDIGNQPRKKFTALNTAVLGFLKEAATDAKKTESTTYYFGKKKLSNDSALEKQVKSVLPEDCKKHASQAVNSLVKNDTSCKDAKKAGDGVKHASAGKKGTGGSCTVFFKREEKSGGLETEVTVVGVGSHSGSSSYDIHWSGTTKLTEGKTFSL